MITPKQLGKVASLPDQPTGGALVVSGTIEQYRALRIAQSTAGQSVTLPTPTDATVVFAVDVINTGTVAVTVEGLAVPVGSTARIAWDGTQWATGAAAVTGGPYVGANATTAGTSGLPPAAPAGAQDLVWHGDGLWRMPIPNWTANTDYSDGAPVFQNRTLLRRRTAGKSGLSFDATEAAEWEGLADLSGRPAVHLTRTTVAAAVPASPTLAELQAAVTAVPLTDGFAFYTGTDLGTDPATYAVVVDSAGRAFLVDQPGATGAVITQAQITNPLDTTPGLITGQRAIQAGNAYHDATVIYQASGSLDFNTVNTAGPLGNPLFQGAFENNVNLSNAPMGAALGAHGIWYYTGSTTDGTIDLTITDSRQVSYHAHRDLVGGVWGAWAFVSDSDWLNSGNNWQVTSGMSVVIGDGHNLTVTHVGGNGAGIRLVPASDWSQVGTITPTVTSWPVLGAFPTTGRQMVTLAPDQANSRWIITMGGTLRDVTPAALPADLAALTAAVPPAGEPGPNSWIARYGTPGNIQLAGIEGGAWVALGTAANTQAVVEQASGATPTVGRLNIYPSGAAIGTAPAVVVDGEYSTALMDASGTTYGPITRWVEVGGQWRNQTAVAAAAGTIHYGRYHWENQPLNTVGGTASSLTQEQQFGSAITRNGANSRVQLAQGFTYSVRMQVTRGQAEVNWVHYQPKWNIGGGDVNVPNTAFFFGDDESNWQGGGAVEFYVAVPSANAAPATVWLERAGSGGNGNTSGDIIVTAIAQESGAGLPAAWPQRLVTCAVDGTAGTFNGRANVVGYDQQTMLVDIDIPAGRSIVSIAGSTLNGGAADVAVGFAGLVSVTPNSGNMHLTCTTGVAETFNSWQRVVTVTPNLAITAADQTINMGVTLVEGDELRFIHRYNNSAGEESSGHVAVRAGTSQRHAFWPDTTGGLHFITFPGVLGTTFTIRQNTAGSSPRILAVELWRVAPNGYNVPVGTTVATPRTITTTVNGTAGLVDGATSSQGFEAIGREVRITMPAGHRLDVLTPPGGGATAEITNQLTGTIYVVPGPGPVNLVVTTVMAATYKGLQRVYPTFRPAAGITDIADNTLTTNRDLTNAAVERLEISFTDSNKVDAWPVAVLDLRATRTNGDHYYVWNHYDAYINVYIDNYATGAIRFNDQVRGGAVRSIDFVGYADIGYSIPTATTTAVQRAITVNGGAVQVNGAASVNILEGVGAYHLTATLPAGKWVDAPAFATANAAKGATLIDRRTGEFSIQIPTGGAAVDITMAFVDHTEVAAALTLTGAFNHIDGAHSDTNLQGLAVIDNEGSGLSIGTDSVITVTRPMILACGLTIESSEGGAIVLWPRIQLDRNDGDGFFTVSEDNHGNPASGAEQWTTQYGPFRAVAGSRLKFDSRVNGPYPGGRTGTLWVRELAADNGAVLAPGTTLATAHNITATVDGAAANVDGAAGAVAYQQIGKVVRITLPPNRQLDSVTASGGAIATRIDALGGTVYVVAGNADSVLTCTTVPAATYQGLQFVQAWEPAGGSVDVENLTINTGIDMRLIDWLVVHVSDPGNDRRWPVMWLPISKVADNVDVWYNTRDVGYGRWQIRNRTTGQMWWEDDNGSIQINRIEAWRTAAVGFTVPTATTLMVGRTITVAPGAQVVQGLEGVWTTIRLAAKTAAQQITSIAATNGAQVDIIDAARGIIAVQPAGANTDVTCTLGPVGAVDFIRLAGSKDMTGATPTVVSGVNNVDATLAIPSAGIWRFDVSVCGWHSATGGVIAARVDLLDAGGTSLDADVVGVPGNKPANQWFGWGTATLRASLPSPGNYRVRLSQTTGGPSSGLAINGLVAERR